MEDLTQGPTIMEDLTQGSTILQLARMKELTPAGFELTLPGMGSERANQRAS